MLYWKALWPDAIYVVLGIWWIIPLFSWLWTYLDHAVISEETKYDEKRYLWWMTIKNFFIKLDNPTNKNRGRYDSDNSVFIFLGIPLLCILFYPLGIPFVLYMGYLVYEKYKENKEELEDENN